MGAGGGGDEVSSAGAAATDAAAVIRRGRNVLAVVCLITCDIHRQTALQH